MAWHTSDWVSFIFRLLQFLASIFTEARKYEEENDGGVLTKLDEDAKKKGGTGFV